MADYTINLNNYKASGVYTVEVDQSENVVLPLTTGRLIVGSSRVGPFNTVVLINDMRTLKAVFGDIDPKLEKAGSFFHRSIEVALREGPVFALNVMPLDTTLDPMANLDQAYFTTFNTEAASNNNDQTTVVNTYPVVNFFNRRRLWFADSAQLNLTKNIALGDDPTQPDFGQVTEQSNKILSFVNLGNSNVTIWVRKAAITGYDLTAKEWYSTIGTGISFPSFVHPDDLISDYFVEVIAVSGDWSNYLRLSKDPIYKAYFDESGLKAASAANFFALREITVVNRTVGCLIPDFNDQTGSTVAIDRLINRAFASTGILCALDTEKLDLINLADSSYNDQSVETYRVDIVGQGYDDLVYFADNGGYDTNLTTEVAPTPLIDTISYRRPGNSSLIFKMDSTIAESTISATIANGEQYLITTPSPIVDYIIATENSKMYEAYMGGFLKTGDRVVDGTHVYYIKITDGLIAGSPSIKYIRIDAYSDITLTNVVSMAHYATASPVNTYVKVELASGSDFKHTFSLTSDFVSYSITQPNKLTIEFASANKAAIDEFIKTNQYIKARTTAGRTRFLKIISITSSYSIMTTNYTYNITTMSPSTPETVGIDITGNTIEVYKGIYNFVSTLKGQYAGGFKIREALLPNGTAARLENTDPNTGIGILEYLFAYTSIPQALATGEIVDFRYVVDSYAGTISHSSKYQLAKLAALHGQAMAILNDPSVQQLEKSVDPSFIDTTTKLVSAEYISTGGNLAANPQFTFAFAEEDINGVPLSSYSTYFFPNLIIRDGNKNISVPPAAYVSNLYVRKFKNGTPFLIVAGGKRGVISDPEIVGIEYDLTDEDRGYLEPVGHNLIVKRRGFGILVFTNNTAYQRVNSALNNAHVRDNLSTIERDIDRILFNFLFDFNDEITRLRVSTLVKNYLDAVTSASGISSYTVTFDTSNNTNEVISANAAILDIKVDFPRGIQKFINRITITRVGGQLSSQSTGFIPSF